MNKKSPIWNLRTLKLAIKYSAVLHVSNINEWLGRSWNKAGKPQNVFSLFTDHILSLKMPQNFSLLLLLPRSKFAFTGRTNKQAGNFRYQINLYILVIEIPERSIDHKLQITGGRAWARTSGGPCKARSYVNLSSNQLRLRLSRKRLQ